MSDLAPRPLSRDRALTVQTDEVQSLRGLIAVANAFQQAADDADREAQHARVRLRDMCAAADRRLVDQGEEPLPALPEDVRP